MPKKCNVYGCRGKYRGEPYTKVVPFPSDGVERNRWIDAMPNDRSSLLQLKQIYACVHHFDCDWVTVKCGKRPSQPPSIFPGVPQSCLKQVSSTPSNTSSSAEARARNEELRTNALDKIGDFDSFCYTVIQQRFSQNHLIILDGDVYISKTDTQGRSVVQFLHLHHGISPIGFLFLKCVEKNGKEIPKSYFSVIPKSYFSKLISYIRTASSANGHNSIAF